MTIRKERAFIDGERYLFDFKVCTPAKGWAQLDTAQDAWYFGNWINPTLRQIINYAEGDVTRTYCDTDEEFAAEVKSACEWYADNDGKRPGIDSMMCVALKARLIAVGLGEWLH